MKIVIVGDGKVGYALTRQLSREGHDIVVIDNRDEAIRSSLGHLDVMGIQGNGASLDVQREAGVDKADLLIAVTSSDELNLLCCVLARKLGAGQTIARVRNPEYADQVLFLREELGLSMTINPELEAAREIARILRTPAALDVDSFGQGRVDIVEFRLNPGNPLIGTSLSHMHRAFKVRVLICAVLRGDDVFIPGGDFVLAEGDRVHVAAQPKEQMAFLRELGLIKNRMRDVMIIGGSHIAYYLAHMLGELGMQVTIIERDRERCHYLNDRLPKANIINADGSDEEVLAEEGLEDTDAFVALTGIDEVNIIISMYAGQKKVDRILTKVTRPSFQDILNAAGVESVITPAQITSDIIVRFVRALQNADGSSVETLSCIVDDRVEALEFIVRDNCRFIGQPLKDLRLKHNLLIAAIIRGRTVIIPGGQDSVALRDHVVVVTTQVNLDDINDVLM